MSFPVGNFHKDFEEVGDFWTPTLTPFFTGCNGIPRLKIGGLGGAGEYFGSIDLNATTAPTQHMMKEKIVLNKTKGHGVGILFGAY